MKNIVVLYHADCPDGFSGAWIAQKKLGNKAEYIPVYYHLPPPPGLKNKEIYLIDFTFPSELIKKLIKENKKVVIIDHHITSEERVKLAKEYLFNTNHSGAMLAWRYFYKNKPAPRLIKYIEDMDLWRFRLPYTAEIISFIEIFDFNFKNWDKLSRDLESPAERKEIIKQGKIIERYEDRVIERIIREDAEAVKFAGYKTLAVNTQFSHSKLGNVLVKRMPPISITWTQRGKQRFFSLRSDGSVNVGELAKRFPGGGGQKGAAGFSLPTDKPLPWKPIK